MLSPKSPLNRLLVLGGLLLSSSCSPPPTTVEVPIDRSQYTGAKALERLEEQPLEQPLEQSDEALTEASAATSKISSTLPSITIQTLTQAPLTVAPTFNDYPVTTTFTGIPAPLQLDEHLQGRVFRATLEEAAQAKPNFAGTYTLVSWGCGTSCQQVAMVSAETGQATFLPQPAAVGVEHQLNSRLLVLNPPAKIEEVWGTNPPDWLITQYYVWDGEYFELLQ
ncbi:MAG: hypothetical protein AAGF24_05355 [Cyanobacteria bacterium P01_H01_bin.121]